MCVRKRVREKRERRSSACVFTNGHVCVKEMKKTPDVYLCMIVCICKFMYIYIYIYINIYTYTYI